MIECSRYHTYLQKSLQHSLGRYCRSFSSNEFVVTTIYCCIFLELRVLQYKDALRTTAHHTQYELA